MEEHSSILGFKETRRGSDEEEGVVVGNGGYKLVPWISWDDWNFVSDSLFSSSPPSISSALHRISAWRSRGCVPVVIEVTASIIEIQQKDPFFRDDLTDKVLQSEEMLAMLYCMAIMRLVNGVVEKTRKKTEVSIAEAADAIDLPRMLIDIRHECSHRDLPSLRLVRLASIKALDWLKSYYWEPQKTAIPCPSDKAANLRKEIKSTIRELGLCLNIQQIERSSSSVVKRKRVRHHEHLCGRNKFLSLMAVKLHSSKPTGSKKQIEKVLKNLVQLYSSFSSDVVSVVLEFLLKALDSADLETLLKSSHGGISSESFQTVFDEWKPFILKLSKKEPDMLLTLLKAVLQMIEAREGVKYDLGEHLTSLQEAEFCKTEQLSCLFEWLVDSLKELRPSSSQKSAAEVGRSPKEMNLPKASLVDILHKCLLVSLPGNGQLTASAIVLARMIGNDSLVEKLNKLALLHASNSGINEENMPLSSPGSFLSQQEDYICQAAKKLEYFKFNRMNGNKLQTRAGGSVGENKSKWTVVKSWKACPIGMLPCALGSSGLLPVLDCGDDHEEVGKLAESNEDKWELNQCSGGKREADCAIEVLDNCNVKKIKESKRNKVEEEEEDTLLEEGVKGRMMTGGVWKRVSEEELLAIASAVRILV